MSRAWRDPRPGRWRRSSLLVSAWNARRDALSDVVLPVRGTLVALSFGALLVTSLAAASRARRPAFSIGRCASSASTATGSTSSTASSRMRSWSTRTLDALAASDRVARGRVVVQARRGRCLDRARWRSYELFEKHFLRLKDRLRPVEGRLTPAAFRRTQVPRRERHERCIVLSACRPLRCARCGRAVAGRAAAARRLRHRPGTALRAAGRRGGAALPPNPLVSGARPVAGWSSLRVSPPSGTWTTATTRTAWGRRPTDRPSSPRGWRSTSASGPAGALQLERRRQLQLRGDRLRQPGRLPHRDVGRLERRRGRLVGTVGRRARGLHPRTGAHLGLHRAALGQARRDGDARQEPERRADQRARRPRRHCRRAATRGSSWATASPRSPSAASRAHQPSFAARVQRAAPGLLPRGDRRRHRGREERRRAQAHIDEWLARNPDLHFWAIQYGTNDAAGDSSDTSRFRANMQTIVDRVRAAGRVPILASIPFAVGRAAPARPRLQRRARRAAQRERPAAGPDLYAWFAAHPEELRDGVHPNDEGSCR